MRERAKKIVFWCLLLSLLRVDTGKNFLFLYITTILSSLLWLRMMNMIVLGITCLLLFNSFNRTRNVLLNELAALITIKCSLDLSKCSLDVEWMNGIYWIFFLLLLFATWRSILVILWKVEFNRNFLAPILIN